MEAHSSQTLLCCICEAPNYSLHTVLHGGCRWVTLEVRNQPVYWLVACAGCLSTQWREMKDSVDLADMPSSYQHNKHDQLQQRIDKQLKDKLVKAGRYKAADVDEEAVVQLKGELKDKEIQWIESERRVLWPCAAKP